MKKLIRLLVLLMVMPLASQSIEKFSIDSGGASASAGGIQILYTIGEVNVQEASAGGISISEGFINSLKLEIKITPIVFLQGHTIHRHFQTICERRGLFQPQVHI